LPISFRTSAGTPTDPTTPDTEFSSDGGATFADTAEEITTGGTNGMGYLTLSGAETNNNFIWIAAKSANDLTTPVIVVPRILAIVGSGTLSAGSAGGGTLGTLLSYDVTGCFIRTTGGTGGGGTGGANNQARKIITYTTSTGAFTVSPNWETTPDATTTYDVLLPEGVTLGMLRTLNPTTAGRTLDVSTGGEAGLDWANVGSPTTTLALTGTTIAVTQKVDVDTIKTNPVVNGGTITFPTNATLSSLTQTQVTGGAYALNSSSFAFNSGLDFTTTQKAATLARVTLTDTLTTYTGNTVQTGDSYAKVNDGTIGLAAIKGYVDDIGVAGAGLTAITNLLPTSLSSGNMKCDVVAWRGTAPSVLQEDGAKAMVQVSIESLQGVIANANTMTDFFDGSGYGEILQGATIDVVNSQTSFTLNAGAADNDAYNNCVLVLTDQSTQAQKSVVVVLDYTGSTKTVILKEAPTFTIVAGDIVTILADKSLKSTVDNNTFDVNSAGEGGLDWANIGGKTTVNALTQTTISTAQVAASVTGNVGGIAGTTQTLDALQTALNSAHGAGSWATATGFSTLTATQVWALADGIEIGVTPKQAMQRIGAVVAGEISGAGTGTEVFKDVGDNGTTRVTVTVDTDGNRTSVVYA